MFEILREPCNAFWEVLASHTVYQPTANDRPSHIRKGVYSTSFSTTPPPRQYVYITDTALMTGLGSNPCPTTDGLATRHTVASSMLAGRPP